MRNCQYIKRLLGTPGLRDSAQGKANMEGDSAVAGVQTSLQHMYYSY